MSIVQIQFLQKLFIISQTMYLERKSDNNHNIPVTKFYCLQ